MQSQSQAVTQEIVGMGWLSWANNSKTGSGPHVLEVFNDLGGVQQIVCAERCLLALTRTGRVYVMYYSSDTQVSGRIGWVYVTYFSSDTQVSA